MSTPNRLPARARLAAFRLFRGIAAWFEPRDPSHLARRLDYGDVVWRAHKEASSALIQAGRLDEAERMAERGLSSFPDDPAFLIDHALCAHNAGRYAEAAKRWTLALAHTEQAMPYAGLAANLRELGDLDRAQATIENAMRRFPDDLVVVSEAARIAQSRASWREALALWEKTVAAPRPHADWLQAHAQALLHLGAFDEAQAAIGAALAAAPDHQGLLAVEAALATGRRDWPTAFALWSAYHRRFPDDPLGAAELAFAGRHA